MNPFDFLQWLAPIAVSLVVVVAGALAFRPALARATSETQQRLIVAQKQENTNLLLQIAQLQAEIERLKKEIERLGQVQDTLRYVLKPMGIDINVEGDFVRVYEAAGAKALTVTPIKRKPKHNPVVEVEPSVQPEKEES